MFLSYHHSRNYAPVDNFRPTDPTLEDQKDPTSKFEVPANTEIVTDTVTVTAQDTTEAQKALEASEPVKRGPGRPPGIIARRNL